MGFEAKALVADPKKFPKAMQRSNVSERQLWLAGVLLNGLPHAFPGCSLDHRRLSGILASESRGLLLSL
jgi:hypothetical protein